MGKTVLHSAFGEAKSMRDWAQDPRCRGKPTAESLAQRVRGGTPLEAVLVFSRVDVAKGYWAFGEVRPLALWLRDPRCSIPGSILRARLESGERFERAITRPASEPLLAHPFEYGSQGRQREDLSEAMLDLEHMWRVAKLTLYGETKSASKWALDPRSEVNYMTLMNRIRSGWPEDPVILHRIGIVNKFTHRYIALTVEGLDLGEFPNLRTAEEAILAISASGMVLDRITKIEIVIPRVKEVSANLARSALPVTAWGETKSRSEWARDPRCLVSLPTLSNRLDRKKRKRWEPEDAMTAPPSTRFVSERMDLASKFYSGFGESKTAAGWAKDPRCKVPPTTLARHLRKGMPLEEALHSGHPRYTAFGETKTIGQWAADPRCKVSSAALRDRVWRGQPMELALAGMSSRKAPARQETQKPSSRP